MIPLTTEARRQSPALFTAAAAACDAMSDASRRAASKQCSQSPTIRVNVCTRTTAATIISLPRYYPRGRLPSAERKKLKFAFLNSRASPVSLRATAGPRETFSLEDIFLIIF